MEGHPSDPANDDLGSLQKQNNIPDILLTVTEHSGQEQRVGKLSSSPDDQVGEQCLDQPDQVQGLRRDSSKGDDGALQGALQEPQADSAISGHSGQEDSGQQPQGQPNFRVPAEDIAESFGRPGQRGALPGVPPIQGEEEVGPQVRLPAGRARHILAELRKAEQVWNDLDACLTGGEPELVKLKEKFRQQHHKGMSKKSKAHYKELMTLSSREVAEVYNPARFGPRAVKHNLQQGKAFDIVLGHDLLKPTQQQSVLSYIRCSRPGLVVISPPCGPFSQLNNLLADFRRSHLSSLKRYLKKVRDGKKLLHFAVEVCELCYSLGCTFVFEQPWGASSWLSARLQQLGSRPNVWLARTDQCRFGLKDTRGGLLRKRTGFLTNHRKIAEGLEGLCPGDHQHAHVIGKLDGKSKSSAAQEYPQPLVDMILRQYSRTVGQASQDIYLVHYQKILEEDQKKDHRYFTQEELAEIENNTKEAFSHSEHNGDSSHFEHNGDSSHFEHKADSSHSEHNGDSSHFEHNGDSSHFEHKVDSSHFEHKVDSSHSEHKVTEVHHNTDGDHLRVDPRQFGVTQDMLQTEGTHKVDDNTTVMIQFRTSQVPLPLETDEAYNHAWRTTWVAREDGTWQLIEDEIRWQELHRPQRGLPRPETVVSLYKNRMDRNYDKKMLHFPGMGSITLEGMVRRAHEGLGHPETQRFVRILRHSKAPEEAINIAKGLRCSVCESYKLPEPSRSAAPPREDLYINDLVGIDTVHLRDHRDRPVPALNMIDWHTHFQLVVPMAAETSAEARKAYRQWIRFFGAPKKVLVDLGSEFKAEFKQQIEADGTEFLPSSLEAPTQRGLTERAGGIFKSILYKAMEEHQCQNLDEWRELVDISCMVRNRLLLRAGYSPIQRVIGYTPRLPGGLLSGGEMDESTSSLQTIGDIDVRRSMSMRKAAACAFHAADCDQALRSATLAGRRKHLNIEVGQALYFWRRGAATQKKPRHSYWQGPGRVVLTSLPNAVWIIHQGALIKAAPERTRPATEEESLSVSGWMRGISQARQSFERMPNRNFLDLTKDADIIDEEPDEMTGSTTSTRLPATSWLPPTRRVRQKVAGQPIPEPGEGMPETIAEASRESTGPTPGLPTVPEQSDNVDDRQDGEQQDIPPMAELFDETAPEPDQLANTGLKREGEEQVQPPGKRSRNYLLEVYSLAIQSLAKQRQKREAQAKDFTGADARRLKRAILKEVQNNMQTGAYKLLSVDESRKIKEAKPDKIMESRYVLTKKDLEPSDIPKAQSEDLFLDDKSQGPCKAKCRHVMKGFSESAALEVEATTPQVSRDSAIYVAQVIASMGWRPGFLDFTQAFHAGDPINRELYCSQPKEGIPGAHPQQLLQLLKTCYGLTDGPYAWYQHLVRRLVEDYGYRRSRADPCVFYLHINKKDGKKELRGIIGVATDDLLHGGAAEHWKHIETISKEYNLGKNNLDAGRFTGKDFRRDEDGSIHIGQEFYVKEKVKTIPLTKKRKQQRFSRCTELEVEALRSQLGVLSWLAKETRCDLAGRVSMLQQCFPSPRVADLVECNKIADEAHKYSGLGIRVQPIPWQDLRISVVTDAAWGNAKESVWLEDSMEDSWEELEDRWVRHHPMGTASSGGEKDDLSSWSRSWRT